MPRATLPKKSKLDIAKPKKSKILISTPVKSKIDIRKKKQKKILMPEALRAHMLEKEANRLYMRDMKTQNIEDKTKDKTENETEVVFVTGIPTAQKLNLPHESNKPKKAKVSTINGVPVTVPVGAKSSRAKAPVINGDPVTVPAGAKVPVVNDVPVIVPAGAKSGSFRKRPKKLANTRTPIELPQPTLVDIVTLNAPNKYNLAPNMYKQTILDLGQSKKQNKIGKKSSRKPNIAPKPPALAPSPIKQPRLQKPIPLPKPSPPKTRKSPLSQMQPEHQNVKINRPQQRRKRSTRVHTNKLPQAFNTEKAVDKVVDKVIEIQEAVRRAQKARKATKARAKARKEELERIEQERIERERRERERKEREIEEQKHKSTKIQAVVRGKKLRQNMTRQRKNKQVAFLMLKRQKNKKMSNNKLTKKANKKRTKAAFNIIKKELKTNGNNGNNYENYELYEPFNPEPVVRVSYVPYGQIENKVLEKLEADRHLLRQLKIGNKFTDIFGDRTPTNLVKNVLDENLSNNPIEVQEQLGGVIEILAKAATNIQTKYRGKKSRRILNNLRRQKESRKMLKTLGRFQQQKLNLIKQLVRNQLVKGNSDKKLNMKMKAKILELDIETATVRDIEAAYRKFALLYHPNKNPNMDPRKIKKFFLIKEARNYLLRDVNKPTRTLALQNTTLKPLALQFKPKPKNIIHPSLSQHLLDRQTRRGSAATKLQATQRKRLALAKRRRLAEQDQKRKRAEEERKEEARARREERERIEREQRKTNWFTNVRKWNEESQKKFEEQQKNRQKNRQRRQIEANAQWMNGVRKTEAKKGFRSNAWTTLFQR